MFFGNKNNFLVLTRNKKLFLKNFQKLLEAKNECLNILSKDQGIHKVKDREKEIFFYNVHAPHSVIVKISEKRTQREF